MNHYSKIQKKRKFEDLIASRKQTINKFIKINKKNKLENTGGSIISQERLNELTLLFIKKEMLNEINYDNCVTKKVQKIDYKLKASFFKFALDVPNS